MKPIETTKRYSGKAFEPNDIDRIRRLIRENPETNRQQLSYKVCELFDWRKANGGLKDMSCRVALLRMHREGRIELPKPRHKVVPCRSFSRRTPEAEPGTVLEEPIQALDDFRLVLVKRKDSDLWVDICSCNIGIQPIYVASRIYRPLPLSGIWVASRCPAPSCVIFPMRVIDWRTCSGHVVWFDSN